MRIRNRPVVHFRMIRNMVLPPQQPVYENIYTLFACLSSRPRHLALINRKLVWSRQQLHTTWSISGGSCKKGFQNASGLDLLNSAIHRSANTKECARSQNPVDAKIGCNNKFGIGKAAFQKGRRSGFGCGLDSFQLGIRKD